VIPNLGKPAAIGAQAGVVLSPADEARLTRRDVAGYLDLGVTPLSGLVCRRRRSAGAL